MSAPSTAPAMLAALRSALAARPGLASVEIATAGMFEDSKTESIQFHSVAETQVFANIGKLAREETYTVNCWVWIVTPGAGETVIQATRARAYALLAEVEAQLRGDPSVGGTVRVAQYGGANLTQGVNPDGRWAQIDFVIHVEARLN